MTTIREVDIQTINETFGEKKNEKNILQKEREKRKEKYNKKDKEVKDLKVPKEQRIKVKLHSEKPVEPVVEQVAEHSEEVPQEVPQEVSQEVSQPVPKEVPKETSKDEVKEVVTQKTFIVSSSKISDFKQKRTARVQSKEEFVDNLQYTKPCQFCVKKKVEGKDCEWGVCYREVCTYAHSLEELQIAPCSFRDRCMKKDGCLDRKTGKVDGNKKFRCQFKHPGETNDEYYERTGIEKPNLPETSEKTRQARKEKPQEKPREKIQEKPREKIQEKPQEKDQSETTIIQVPRVMQREALELCLMKNLKNFKIILTD